MCQGYTYIAACSPGMIPPQPEHILRRMNIRTVKLCEFFCDDNIPACYSFDVTLMENGRYDCELFNERMVTRCTGHDSYECGGPSMTQHYIKVS